MRLAETLFLSLSVAFFIIGVHQTFVLGLIHSYWLFMLSVSMLLLYKMKKVKPDVNSGQTQPQQPLKRTNKTTTKAKPRK
jgi:hypothetical protein